MNPDPTNEQHLWRDLAWCRRQVEIDKVGEGLSENDRWIVARSLLHEGNATQTRQTAVAR